MSAMISFMAGLGPIGKALRDAQTGLAGGDRAALNDYLLGYLSARADERADPELDAQWVAAIKAEAPAPHERPALMSAALCRCGKPASHLEADPDSREWACRVPRRDHYLVVARHSSAASGHLLRTSYYGPYPNLSTAAYAADTLEDRYRAEPMYVDGQACDTLVMATTLLPAPRL